MRLLHERANHASQGAAGCKSESDGCADTAGNEQHPVPMCNLLSRPRRYQTGHQVGGIQRARSCQRGVSMKTHTNFPKEFEPILKSLDSVMLKKNGTSRRDFLKGSSLLVVGFSMS